MFPQPLRESSIFERSFLVLLCTLRYKDSSRVTSRSSRCWSCAPFQDRVNVLHFFARPEVVQYVVDKVQQLENQIARWHFFLLAKVDHLAVEPPTHRTPFILLNQHAPIEAKAQVLVD